MKTPIRDAGGIRWLLVALVVAAIQGWAAPAWAEAAPAAEQPAEKAYILHLPGIGGERGIDHTLLRGLRDAGIDADYEIYDWTHGDIGVQALLATEVHKRESRKIADLIAERAKAKPGAPIYITCHSAGTGLAAWALEQLPEDVKVHSVFMFASALSPTYDLSKALAHLTGKLHVFSSANDSAVLSVGTKLFGTVDGIKSEAAGLKGFIKPDAADAATYALIVHHPYNAAWARLYGSVGSHICAMRFKFSREYVATVIRTGEPPAQSGPATRPSEQRPSQAGGTTSAAATSAR